ncbi:hypothetical protein K474DRAFT_1666385 [Panus rudis PR-1116 ss-1]|nr:hypothetical protein K474DRAFT_1666385 [Panus rudis PR-1116 ss-1]
MARVCKAISQPALDAIWRNIENLRPLMHLQHCLKTETSAKRSSRMLTYTSRVRSLRIKTEDMPDEMFDDLWNATHSTDQQRTYAFPVLRELCLLQGPAGPHADVCQGTYLDLFASPSLLNLMLEEVSPPHRRAPLPSNSRFPLDILCRICPHLEEIGFTTGLGVTPLYLKWAGCESDFLDTLIQFRSLRSVNISAPAELLCPGSTMIKKLSTLRHLERLVLESFDEPSPSICGTHAGLQEVATHRFESLQELCLTFPLSSFIASLRSLPRNCAIPRCNLTITKSSSGEISGCDIIDEITARLSPSRLEMICIEIRAPPPHPHMHEPSPIQFDNHAIRKLLPFTRLSVVRLRPVSSSTITDSLCHDMSKAWPRLQEIQLPPWENVWRPFDFPEMATLWGVREFAMNCPELKSLAMEVNGAGDDWDTRIEKEMKVGSDGDCQEGAPVVPVATQLTVLDLDGTLITCPRAVAPFLRWCFPKVRKVGYHIRGQAGFMMNRGRNLRQLPSFMEAC